MSLSNQSLPYKGLVQINVGGRIKNVCWNSLKGRAYDIFCRELGYTFGYFPTRIPTPVDAKHEIFSGSISCNGHEEYISQCSIKTTSSRRCSELTHLKCKCRIRLKKNGTFLTQTECWSCQINRTILSQQLEHLRISEILSSCCERFCSLC